MQQVSRSFREHLVMKSMVSVRLRGKDVVTRSSVTSSLVIGSRKLTKTQGQQTRRG